MTNPFSQIMSERTDEQLVDIVTRSRTDYQPEALEAAEEEMARRELSVDAVEALGMTLEEKKIVVERKAQEPLNPVWKVFAFLFPGFFNVMVGLVFKSDGYERQYKEVVRWTLYGVGFYVVLTLVLTNL